MIEPVHEILVLHGESLLEVPHPLVLLVHDDRVGGRGVLQLLQPRLQWGSPVTRRKATWRILTRHLVSLKTEMRGELSFLGFLRNFDASDFIK